MGFRFSTFFQADVETDEVYAQMTLQPLTPVWFYNLELLFFFSNLQVKTLELGVLVVYIGGAEGNICTDRVGDTEQAT